MEVCILNSETKVVVNKVILNSIEDFIPYQDGIEVASQHDGEIGWIWNGTGWDSPDYSTPLDIQERERRDKYLQINVDVINAVRCSSLTQQQQDDLIAYRQALLDVPQQEGFPDNITWPVEPQL